MCQQTQAVMSIQQEIETRKQYFQSHPNELKTPQNNPYPPTCFPNTPAQQSKQTRPTQKVSEPSPKQTSPIQQPKQTRSTPQPQQQPRQTTYEPPPMAPPEQTSPAQTVPEPSPVPPPKPMAKLTTRQTLPMQSPEQTPPIQASIQSTSPAPEKSPTPPPKKAPSSELERKKLVFYRCSDCKIYALWFQEKAEYICPVCAAEYRIESVCPGCGTKVTPNATQCPNCGEALEEGNEEETKTLCFACETEVNWDEKKGISICPECGIEYIILRACPICRSKITREANMCHRCDKVLEEEEGEYMYPVCPDHGNPMEYNSEDGFSCPECLVNLDQEEEDEEEFECPECRAVLPGGLAECPKCGTEFEDEGVSDL